MFWQRKPDRRDQLIAELLSILNASFELAALMDAENDHLREVLREIEQNWRDCLDPYRKEPE